MIALGLHNNLTRTGVHDLTKNKIFLKKVLTNKVKGAIIKIMKGGKYNEIASNFI